MVNSGNKINGAEPPSSDPSHTNKCRPSRHMQPSFVWQSLWLRLVSAVLCLLAAEKARKFPAYEHRQHKSQLFALPLRNPRTIPGPSCVKNCPKWLAKLLSGDRKGKVPPKKSEWQRQNMDTPNVILPAIPNTNFFSPLKFVNVSHVALGDGVGAPPSNSWCQCIKIIDNFFQGHSLWRPWGHKAKNHGTSVVGLNNCRKIHHGSARRPLAFVQSPTEVHANARPL